MDVQEVVEDVDKIMLGCSRWYPNDQQAYSFRYKNGKAHGKQEAWYTTGIPAYIYNYKNGKKHGRQRKFNVVGTLISCETYRNGKLVK
jgi:antitoxin component YwqK of YwqJK toxin-antitoxin module